MASIFNALREYVYPSTAPDGDESGCSTEKIVVYPAETTTSSQRSDNAATKLTPPSLSVPQTVTLSTLQPPQVADDSDSDSDMDSEEKKNKTISVPALSVPANPTIMVPTLTTTPVMTLSTADEPEVKEAYQGVPAMGRFTLSDVKEHKSIDDAWTVLNGKVYNITPYMPFHPGGEKELMRCAGRDGTRLFNLTHKWVNYEFMMKECQVGFLVSEGSTSNKLTV
ncbi:hypothetical protein BGW38_007065 [Lunasporangiospora selenospora]|uniref:Cytochrome b5 heme-binding domain-containing protein n=1 Tax=Lunasporangiospora selenospora TaxID=979761 RepID=A0A9P6FYM5_9FUNG|nr:hypothetical protein BGW38_007065 [Lunasporangiospora selenospora]